MDANPHPRVPARTPLSRALADGSAGAVTRLLVSLAVGSLLVAFGGLIAYTLSHLFPPSGARTSGGGYPAHMIYISDEVAAISYILAGLIYLALLVWIWSRQRRNRAIWLGVVLTVGIGLATLALCLLVEVVFTGDEEFLIVATACAGGGFVLLVWIRLYRSYAGGRALYDESGVIDLRCPACQYRMVGLKQSRCPECGQEYTLDELVSKQDFEILRLRRSLIGPPDQPAECPRPAEVASADDGK